MNEQNQRRYMRCFQLARHVVHYYWMYLGGEGPGERVRIENIEKIIERMVRIPITKLYVPIEGDIIRGFTERYADSIKIYVRSGQSIEWQKYTAVKEFCHVLYDQMEDYQPDPGVTLGQLVQPVSGFIDDEMSAARVSEELTEVMALELIYPHEYREEDAKFLEDGGEMDELVDRRHVPAHHIALAVRPKYRESCKRLWELVQAVPQDEKLDPFKED